MMILSFSTLLHAQDAMLSFNYTASGPGNGFYNVQGDPQNFSADCALQTTPLRAGAYTVSANFTRNNRRALSGSGNSYWAGIGWVKYATKAPSSQTWVYEGTLASRNLATGEEVATGVDYAASITIPQGYQILIYLQSNWDVPGSFAGFENGTGTTGAFKVDGAPGAPSLNNIVATNPDQNGYRYPLLTWTNPSNDAGDLSSLRIYRRIRGRFVGSDRWLLLTTLSPSGHSQSQNWTDNSISTTGMGNDIAEYTLTVSDNSLSPNVSIQSNIKEINFSTTALFSVREKEFQLSQNYPNPFNPITTIDFSLPERATVSLKVFDALGREVAALLNESREPGVHQVAFNAGALSSGVYYYTLRYKSVSQTKKMILAK